MSPSCPRRYWDAPVAYDDMETRLKTLVAGSAQGYFLLTERREGHIYGGTILIWSTLLIIEGNLPVIGSVYGYDF